MTVKRFITAIGALGLVLSLASCGGASESGFSAYVADHWPHWAGGMPNDVPPRPGSPGYDEFIAHGLANQDATKPPATGATATTTPVTPVFKTVSPAPAAATVQATSAVEAAPETQVEPAPDAETAPQPSSDDKSVVKGGLY